MTNESLHLLHKPNPTSWCHSWGQGFFVKKGETDQQNWRYYFIFISPSPFQQFSNLAQTASFCLSSYGGSQAIWPHSIWFPVQDTAMWKRQSVHWESVLMAVSGTKLNQSNVWKGKGQNLVSLVLELEGWIWGQRSTTGPVSCPWRFAAFTLNWKRNFSFSKFVSLNSKLLH